MSPSAGTLPRMPSLTMAMLVATAIAVCVVAVLTFTLKYGSNTAALLLDHQQYSVFPYPMTIQNATYLILAAGMATLYVRWRIGLRERAFLLSVLLR